ncbi:MAG: hypothetical protein QXP51_05165 [Candidatus Hadarchaeales archaeon]
MLTKSLESAVNNKVSHYERKYGHYFQLVEDYRKKNFLRELSDHEKLALGQYMENWEKALPIFENDATVRAQLGDIVQARLGLVALQYATLPVSDLASVQPLQEEAGVIYFRRLVATDTRGGVTAGTTVGNAAGYVYQNPDYYSEETTETFSTVANQTSYTLTLNGTPVRPRYVTVTVGANASGFDNGYGGIFGRGVEGTINYATGAVTLVLNDSLVNLGSDQITITYHQDLTESANIPGFQWKLDSTTVRAQYFAINTQFSTVAEWLVKQRFGGRILSEDLVMDAVAQINATVLSKVVRELRRAAMANNSSVTWSATPPTGVSAAEHRMTFQDTIEEALTNIGNRAGVTALSALVVGVKGRQILATLGMKSLSKTVSGPYLVGYYNETPVFYAPPTLLPDNEVLVVYRGQNWFEAPVVYAPFMPLMVVRGPLSPNPMLQTISVAHAAGITTVVKEFVERVVIQ